MPIKITPATLREDVHLREEGEGVKDNFSGIVIPGETIFTSGANLITGHGTYRVSNTTESGSAAMEVDNPPSADPDTSAAPMRASLAGRLKAVNKLVFVEPPNTRYSGNVGDTIVGRVIEVELMFSQLNLEWHF